VRGPRLDHVPGTVCVACGKEIAEGERHSVMPTGEYIHTPCMPEPGPSEGGSAVPEPVATGELGT